MFGPILPCFILFAPVRPHLAKSSQVTTVMQYGVKLPLLNLTSEKKLLTRRGVNLYVLTLTNTMDLKLQPCSIKCFIFSLLSFNFSSIMETHIYGSHHRAWLAPYSCWNQISKIFWIILVIFYIVWFMILYKKHKIWIKGCAPLQLICTHLCLLLLMLLLLTTLNHEFVDYFIW